MSLNPRQTGFVAEFLVDRNATQAAIRAGYSKRCARQIANELLTKPDIQAQIQVKCEAAEKRLEITFDDVLRGFLSAYKLAEQQGQPMAMVAACRELGRMLGYYDRKQWEEKLPVVDAERLRRHLATLSDGRLLELAEKG